MKKKTAEYLMRAEHISSQHLKVNMGQGSTQTVVSGRLMPNYSCVLHIYASTRVLKPLEAVYQIAEKTESV